MFYSKVKTTFRHQLSCALDHSQNANEKFFNFPLCFAIPIRTPPAIPITMRSRATTLLSRLKAKPDVIRWDKTGQVKIEGETIPGSNISDLVSDAMRSRKDFNPTGSKEFFQALSKLNVPKDLVRNRNRWKEVLGGTSGTMATPKLSIRSSPQFQKLLKSYEEKGTPKRWEKY